MFERNIVDSGSDAGRKTIAVTIAFSDGQVSSGHCYVKATRTLDEELNTPGPFVDFAPFNGERSFVAKVSMVRISRIDLPKANQMSRSAQFNASADPYAILGVQPGAGPQAVQTAYRALAKRYHPDRFAGLDLPQEMAAYASDMARRINEAYSMLAVTEKEDAARRAREAAAAAVPKTAYEEFQTRAASRYS